MRDVARPMLAFILTFIALTWAPLSLVGCYLLLSQFWRFQFEGYAFWAASGAFLICMQIARLILRYADGLLIAPDDPDAPVAPRDEYSHDWRAYNAQIIRYKRWAHYRRTRQFDKLAALENEEQQLAGKCLDRPAGTRHIGGASVVIPPSGDYGQRQAL